jgi:hypothetical protein
MSTLTIVEGQGIGVQVGGNAQQAMMLPHIAIQRVTFSGTAGYGAALNKNTTLIYVRADAAASLLMASVSSGSVGSLTGFPLASGEGQYFSVAAGSAINFPSVVAIS